MTGTNKFDDLLTHLGTGPWNMLYFIASSYWFLLEAPQFISGVYIAPSINYTCLPPEGNESIVAISEDSCSYTKVTESGAKVEEACTEWDFDTSVFSSTLTSEFSLVCGRSYLRAFYQSVYMIGTFFSPLFCGYLADRYGRKRVVVMQQVFTILFSVTISLFGNINVILTFRFLLGIFNLITFIIFALEVCEPKYRATVNMLLGLPWAMGTMAWGGMAFLIRDWRWLQLAVSLPRLLLFPALFFIDESPRWLIVRGHHDWAMQVLRKAARWNHVSLQPESELRALMKNIQKESVTPPTTSTDTETNKWYQLTRPNLLRTRPIQIITVVVCFDYFAMSFMFDGINLSGDNYTSNPFLYLALSGLVEIPGYLLAMPIINRWGRKIPTVLIFVLSGVVIAVIGFIPSDLAALMITLAMVGKVCISGVYQIMYLYASELFPTEVRLLGISVVSVFSQLASSIVPFITTFLGPLVPWVPSLIFGITSVAAGVLTMALRETKDVALPDTIADLSTTTATTIYITSTPTTEKNTDQ